MGKVPIIRSSADSQLPDPKRRVEAQATAATMVRNKRVSIVRLFIDADDPLVEAVEQSEVAPSFLLARGIRDNLDVLNNARVVKLNRRNGQLAGTKTVYMRVHWEQTERFRLAAHANGLSLRAAAEMLLRSALLDDPRVGI